MYSIYYTSLLSHDKLSIDSDHLNSDDDSDLKEVSENGINLDQLDLLNYLYKDIY